MAAHRYWQLYVTAVNANQYVGISEVELFDATYADVTTGASVTHSSTLGGGYEGSKVVDDNHATLWHTSGATTPSVANPEWVAIDLGAGNDKDVIAFSIRGRQDGAAYVSDQCPKDFKLRHSDDGATWTDLFTITAQTGWGILGEKRFYNASGTSVMDPPPPPSAAVGTASKRFWRLRSTAVDSDPNVFALQELEFHTSIGGAQAASGGTAYAANTYAGTPAAAFDGTNAEWIGSDLKEWIGYLFPSAADVVEIKIRARNAFPGQSPEDFIVEYFNGSSFVTAYTGSGQTAWTASEWRTFTWGGGGAAAARPVVFVVT